MNPGTVCFSGHRPEKLPRGNFLHMMQSLLYAEIEDAYQRGARRFLTGMAQGVDLWAADCVLHLRTYDPDVKLICANPFPMHGSGLRREARYHQMTVLHAADEVVQICPQYSTDCFRRRNAYMIEHSDCLIAMVSDMRSGTGQTIRMAKQKGLALRLITLDHALEYSEHHTQRRYYY